MDDSSLCVLDHNNIKVNALLHVIAFKNWIMVLDHKFPPSPFEWVCQLKPDFLLLQALKLVLLEVSMTKI